jgi:O-antigen ligase
MIELEEKIIDDFLKIILLSITIVCFFGFYQYAEIRLDYFERMSKVDRLDELIRVKNTTQQRVSGIFGNELIMGSYLMKIFPLFLITFFFRKKEDILSKSNYVYLFLITILIAISIVITSDRAPILLFCFQIFLFFLLIKKLRKFFFILGTIVFFSFCTIILIDPISKERVVNVTVNNIKGEYTGGNITVISEAYEGHFNAAKIIFKKYPILGSGIKGFRNQCYNLNKENYKEKIWCTTHPHNIFFQIISETGILGLFIYLILFYYVLNQIYQKIKKQIKFEKENILITNLICLINFVVILWPLTTSGSMFNNYNTIFFCLPVILYLASNNKIISKD